MFKSKIGNKGQKHVFSMNQSHNLRPAQGTEAEPFARSKVADSDILLYTKHAPHYSQIRSKNTEIASTRAHQISNLKDKLKIKEKQGPEEPFPSLYKIKEDFEYTKQRSNNNQHLGAETAELLEDNSLRQYYKNSAKQAMAVKKHGNVKLKGSQAQSFDMHNSKNKGEKSKGKIKVN